MNQKQQQFPSVVNMHDLWEFSTRLMIVVIIIDN